MLRVKPRSPWGCISRWRRACHPERVNSSSLVTAPPQRRVSSGTRDASLVARRSTPCVVDPFSMTIWAPAPNMKCTCSGQHRTLCARPPRLGHTCATSRARRRAKETDRGYLEGAEVARGPAHGRFSCRQRGIGGDEQESGSPACKAIFGTEDGCAIMAMPAKERTGLFVVVRMEVRLSEGALENRAGGRLLWGDSWMRHFAVLLNLRGLRLL